MVICFVVLSLTKLNVEGLSLQKTLFFIYIEVAEYWSDIFENMCQLKNKTNY